MSIEASGTEKWKLVNQCDEARDLIRALNASNDLEDSAAVRAISRNLDTHIASISDMVLKIID